MFEEAGLIERENNYKKGMQRSWRKNIILTDKGRGVVAKLTLLMDSLKNLKLNSRKS